MTTHEHPAEDVWDPKDTTPSTEAQHAYLRQLVARLHAEAEWSALTQGVATMAIARLNDVRKWAGLPFREMEGVDAGRHVR